MEEFYNMMSEYNIKQSAITLGIMIKGYGKSGDFNKAYELFEKMVKYGTKNGFGKITVQIKATILNKNLVLEVFHFDTLLMKGISTD